MLNMSSGRKQSSREFYPENTQTSLLDDLIAKWWNWWHTIPADKSISWPDPTHGSLIGSGGDIDFDESVVFFADPSFANVNNANRLRQDCQILDNQAIFFPLYNSVCDTSMPKFRRVNYQQMLDCSTEANSGVEAYATVDNFPVEEKDIVEHYTAKTFNLTYSELNPYLDQPGGYAAVGGGIYLFLKPFPSGDQEKHEIKYGYKREFKNNVEVGEAKYTFSVVESS